MISNQSQMYYKGFYLFNIFKMSYIRSIKCLECFGITKLAEPNFSMTSERDVHEREFS